MFHLGNQSLQTFDENLKFIEKLICFIQDKQEILVSLLSGFNLLDGDFIENGIQPRLFCEKLLKIKYSAQRVSISLNIFHGMSHSF